jgi:hypothetical protein
MKTAFQSLNQGQADNGQNGNNGGNGQNGNRRGGRGGFDPAQQAALQKYMERPEVKAQDEQLKSQEDKISAQYTAAINKVLTARQRTILKKMLGVPFDLASMGAGNPWGFRGGNRPGAPGAQASAKDASKATTTAKTEASEDDEEGAAPAKAAVSAPAKAKASAATKRKSLRESRGSSPSDDN